MTTKPNNADLACASAACDFLKDCHGQVTGSHLARVAQLFADHRAAVSAQARRDALGLDDSPTDEQQEDAADPRNRPLTPLENWQLNDEHHVR